MASAAIGPAIQIGGMIGSKMLGGLLGGGPDLGWIKDIAKDQQGKQGSAWGDLQSILSQVRGTMSPYMSGAGQGYDPLQLALMKSQFLNTAAGKFQGANSQVMSALARRGSAGNGPVGGDYTRGIAALEGGKADSVSNGLMGIDLSNLQQALSNKFNATQMMLGTGGQYGGAMNTFTGGMNNAIGDYLKGSLGVQNSPFNTAMDQGLAKGIQGGLGKLGSKFGGGGGNE